MLLSDVDSRGGCLLLFLLCFAVIVVASGIFFFVIVTLLSITRVSIRVSRSLTVDFSAVILLLNSSNVACATSFLILLKAICFLSFSCGTGTWLHFLLC